MSERDDTSKRKPDKVKETPESYEYRAEDVHAVPYIEERYEIIEGVRYDLSPAPTVAHQKVSAALYLAIHATCHSNGTILYAPIDVYLDEENQFQPDLVMVLHEREPIIKSARIEGAPNLVVEILSPSTSSNDKIRKKRQYEKHGVEEYWIVDPLHFTLDQFVLEQGKFTLVQSYGIAFATVLTSNRFPCLHIEVDKLFQSIRK